MNEIKLSLGYQLVPVHNEPRGDTETKHRNGNKESRAMIGSWFYDDQGPESSSLGVSL